MKILISVLEIFLSLGTEDSLSYQVWIRFLEEILLKQCNVMEYKYHLVCEVSIGQVVVKPNVA